MLRMESDESDSELDIETSTTPDNVSINDGASSDGRGPGLPGMPGSGGKIEVKTDLGSPHSSSATDLSSCHVTSGGGGIGGNGVSSLGASLAALSGTTVTSMHQGFIPGARMVGTTAGMTPGTGALTGAAGGATNLAAAQAAAATAAAAAAASGTDYASLAAKNWLKAGDPTANGLHSFFMPFSAAAAAAAAAAHHAHLPFPHHFNSQGSLFHVKDSV